MTAIRGESRDLHKMRREGVAELQRSSRECEIGIVCVILDMYKKTNTRESTDFTKPLDRIYKQQNATDFGGCLSTGRAQAAQTRSSTHSRSSSAVLGVKTDPVSVRTGILQASCSSVDPTSLAASEWKDEAYEVESGVTFPGVVDRLERSIKDDEA